MIKFNEITAKKAQIRKEILGKLYSQSSSDKAQKSAAIKKKLLKDSCFEKAKSVMFYVSKEYEVDTDDMIRQAWRLRKRIIVPVTDVGKKTIIASELKDPDTELEIGPFGVRQPKRKYIRPVPVNDIDLVITPGVAFNKTGNRIGHGAGYYDSFLKILPKDTFTIGLAYGCQIVEEIPTLSWDIPVKKVISA
ncbi:MAG: 5-formyltetrahydrofolate cyclo-ligase [Candidatus Omnitrophica bacterium]|nr:5-formyltetrahydrofolate cyclo-ligase [Candidatus Omnitrophota bacterium]